MTLLVSALFAIIIMEAMTIHPKQSLPSSCLENDNDQLFDPL